MSSHNTDQSSGLPCIAWPSISLGLYWRSLEVRPQSSSNQNCVHAKIYNGLHTSLWVRPDLNGGIWKKGTKYATDQQSHKNEVGYKVNLVSPHSALQRAATYRTLQKVSLPASDLNPCMPPWPSAHWPACSMHIGQGLKCVSCRKEVGVEWKRCKRQRRPPLGRSDFTRHHHSAQTFFLNTYQDDNRRSKISLGWAEIWVAQIYDKMAPTLSKLNLNKYIIIWLNHICTFVVFLTSFFSVNHFFPIKVARIAHSWCTKVNRCTNTTQILCLIKYCSNTAQILHKRFACTA